MRSSIRRPDRIEAAFSKHAPLAFSLQSQVSALSPGTERYPYLWLDTGGLPKLKTQPSPLGRGLVLDFWLPCSAKDVGHPQPKGEGCGAGFEARDVIFELLARGNRRAALSKQRTDGVRGLT